MCPIVSFATREAEGLVISTVFVFVSYVIQVKTAAAFKKTLWTWLIHIGKSVRPVGMGDPSVASGMTDLAKTWPKVGDVADFWRWDLQPETVLGCARSVREK